MSIIKVFTLLISLFFFSTNLFAENKVAYINVDLILNESIPAKSLLSQLNLIEQKKIKEIKNEEIKLKDEENKILTTKNIISKEEFDISVDTFQKKVDLHRKNEFDILVYNKVLIFGKVEVQQLQFLSTMMQIWQQK